MKDYSGSNIINLAIAGHGSTGKTILSESLLFNAKKIRNIGSIESGTTISDYHDYEIENQHSISLSLLTFEYSDKKINMIDTPGYLDFHGMDPELLQRALSVLVKRGKAQVFGQEDQQGVKFF